MGQLQAANQNDSKSKKDVSYPREPGQEVLSY